MHAQSCPILCNTRDCHLPGSSVHGISQAGILEWVAISFSSVILGKSFYFSCLCLLTSKMGTMMLASPNVGED